MTIDYQIRDEKIQPHVNREPAKISALSSNKIGKYKYLIGEEILPSNQERNNRTSWIYLFSFRKSFWKTNKNNWNKLRLSKI